MVTLLVWNKWNASLVVMTLESIIMSVVGIVETSVIVVGVIVVVVLTE